MEEQYNKNEILSKIDSYEAMNMYLKPYHQNGSLKQGQLISNPFLSRKQKTPSFNIYNSSNGTWRYKDFATEDDGDIIDLVVKLKRVGFKEALRIISEDFGINSENFDSKSFNIKLTEWNAYNIKFWDSYGITKETLSKFNVFPVEHFSRKTKNETFSTIQSTKDNPIYAYKINNNCYKIYQPFSPKYKFSWVGVKPKEYVFGLEQLPKQGDTVFITGGEKDVLSLFSNNYSAISLNSETAIPSQELINKLKQSFNDVVLCYDIDKTGLDQSKKIAEKYQLKRVILSEELKENSGKDISDLFKFGLEFNYKELKFEDFSKDQIPSGNLSLLIQTQNDLRKRKSEKIARTEPILTQNEQNIIFPRTINIIQGKAGVHKSRLAETLSSVFIKHQDYKENHLGFKTSCIDKPTVCYVDTERNLTEQFPYAIQQILLKGGYSKCDDPKELDYISLLEVPRDERFEALTEYLYHVRKKFEGHLIIILDVVTDCIKDFNRSEDSMKLIDLMNVLINKFDVTFIGLIHENPGNTDKARGHLGTELMNKSSTVMQVGFEKGKDNKPTDLILLNYLKTRSTRRYESIYLEYCEESNGLVLADPKHIEDVMLSRQLKASIDDVIALLGGHLDEPTASTDLLKHLSNEFGCSEKLMRERLKKIIDDRTEISNKNNKPCTLCKDKQGKQVIYSLKPITENN